MLYLLIPLGATLWFGLDTGHGIDFSIFGRIFSDPDFSQTLLPSLELALGATILAVVLVTPTAYWVQLRIPRARPLLDFLTLVPFACPAIILAVGLLQEYSGTASPLINFLSLGLVPVLSNNLNIVSTPPLLVCAYVIIALPFVYRPIDNSLRAINTTVLTEAAYSLGSGWWRTFLTVILPNIWPGIISAALLTFSTVMGEFLMLLGPSGCGKTTILRMIAGFETPSEGNILLDGDDITTRAASKRPMGMVFQSYALFPHLTAEQNIAFGMEIKHLPKDVIKRRCAELLELVGLSDKGRSFAHQLSGGQQQRVALARALAVEPKVLLLDEPLSALDAKVRVSLRNEIRRIQQQPKITANYLTP